MPRYPEAALFCLLWVALALWGWWLFDWKAALALSVGLFLIIMPASALTLSRTGSFAIERGMRWGILGVAALAVLLLAQG